jgi:hypothetical protein
MTRLNDSYHAQDEPQAGAGRAPLDSDAFGETRSSQRDRGAIEPSIQSDPNAFAIESVCEPLFQLLCRLNRLKRTRDGAEHLQIHRVREQVLHVFNQMAVRARAQGCVATFDRLAEPLRCFADIVLSRGEFPFSADWEAISGTATPDALLLESAASAESAGDPDHNPGLIVLYTCLCICLDLLNTPDGDYSVLDLMSRINDGLKSGEEQLFCPGAYVSISSRAILPPLGRRLRTLAAGSAALVLLAVAAAVYLNLHYYYGFQESFRNVESKLSVTSVSQKDN